ncbi:MAG TPA: SatD family protein [Opitutaceae bacterium]|jgi:hypothetical protein
MNSIRYALIADMVGSRRAGDHRQVHRQVERALEDINRHFAQSLWAPVGLTKGVDELSAALITGAPAYDLACRLNLLIHPLRFRFAVGWGEVFSLKSNGGPGALDGSAYHAAAAALERARQERIPLALSGYHGDVAPRARAVEALAALHTTLRDEWSPVEAAIAQAMQAHPDATQSELARRTRRTQQAVSRATVRGNFKVLARAEASIREMLADIHLRSNQSGASDDGRS